MPSETQGNDNHGSEQTQVAVAYFIVLVIAIITVWALIKMPAKTNPPLPSTTQSAPR